MKEDLMLHELNIADGKLDMRLSGDTAKLFMIMLVNLFEQNGGKNFLTTTLEGKGKRYGITITNLDGEDSPAERLNRLETLNRELVKLLEKVLDYSEEGLLIDEDFTREIEEKLNPKCPCNSCKNNCKDYDLLSCGRFEETEGAE